MTVRAPAHRTAHITDPGYRAGNSYRGREIAKRRGFRWADNDLRMTLDRVMINTHWRLAHKDKFTTKKIPFSTLLWEEVRKLSSPEGYRIAKFESALKHAGMLNLNLEIEIKDPTLTQEEYHKLARFCREAYGKDWKRHVWVKTLTTINGYAEATERLRLAHEAGFTTVILLRGKDRFRKVNLAWIDYQRGAIRS